MAEVGISVSASALLAMLRREGGFWTVSQLVHHWQPTWSLSEVEQLLVELRFAGHLVRRPSLARAQVESYSARPMPLPMPPLPVGPRQAAIHSTPL